MKTENACAIAALITGTPAFAGGLTIDSFSTSLGIAVDGDGNAVDFNAFPTFARFQNSAPGLDLLVEIEFPNADPNNDGTGRRVGLAGAGLKFQNYNADPDGDGSNGPGRDPFVLNYQFVTAGTNNGVAIDELSVGLRDLDENRGSIGEENILADSRANNITSLAFESGIDLRIGGGLQDSGGQYAALGLTDGDPFDFKLDPNINNNEAVINFADLADGSFSLIFSNEAGGNNLSGGFNLVGGAAIDTTGFTTTQVVPAPGSLALLGLGGLAAMRRRR